MKFSGKAFLRKLSRACKWPFTKSKSSNDPQLSEYADLMGLEGLSEYEVGIGFLPDPWCVSMPHLTIEPLPDLEERQACLDQCLISENNVEFFLPLVESWRAPLGQPHELVDGSKRSASLYFPPVSHRLTLCDSSLDLRGQEVQFVIHFLAYLAGTRLQFHDWSLDTRVVVSRRSRSFIIRDRDVEELTHKAYENFLALKTENKVSMINSLYLMTRSPHLFWEWERYLYDFMVADALRQIQRTEQSLPSKPRLEALCEEFEIPSETPIDQRLRAIRHLRNELFHQGLWAGGIPGTGAPSSAWDAHLQLRALIERLIAGMLNIGTSFRRSTWWSRSPSSLCND